MQIPKDKECCRILTYPTLTLSPKLTYPLIKLWMLLIYIVSHCVETMNQILANALDFSTLSTKGLPMLRFKNKLFVCRKKTRNADGKIHKCYWYCSSPACSGAITYCIDENNVHANQDGTGNRFFDRQTYCSYTNQK
jgi:hypothetical protein